MVAARGTEYNPFSALEALFQPPVVPLEARQHLSDALLDPELVIDVELRPRKQRRQDTLWIVLGMDRLAVRLPVFAADSPGLFLLRIEVVQDGHDRIDPIRVDKEERGEAGVELVYSTRVRMAEVPAVKPVMGRSLFPEVLDQEPRLVVERYQIPIVEVNLREVLLDHTHSSLLDPYCSMPSPNVKRIFEFRGQQTSSHRLLWTESRPYLPWFGYAALS